MLNVDDDLPWSGWSLKRSKLTTYGTEERYEDENEKYVPKHIPAEYNKNSKNARNFVLW